MDNQRVAKQLLRMAKELLGSDGKYFFKDKNGLVVWTDDENKVTPISYDLDKVYDATRPTDSFEVMSKNLLAKFKEIAYGWTWYGLFGVTNKIAKELKKQGFVEKKP